MNKERTNEDISLDKIAETSPAAITKVDKEGNFTYANSKAEEVLGLEKSEIQNRTYNDPDWKITDFEGNDYPADKLPFSIVKSTKEPVEDVRHAIEWPDGERKFLSINASPLFKDNGDFDGVVIVIEDITDPAETREELKQDRERYQKYFEELGDAVFILAMGGEDLGKILEVNPTAVEQSGYSREELIGMNLIEDLSLEPPPDLDLEEVNEKLDRGDTVNFVEKKKKKNGDEYWTEVVVTPIEYEGRKANLSINRDITDRREAEAELEKSEAKFRAISEQSHDGLFIYKGDKFEWLNERTSEILGYSKEELYGKSIWDLLHPEDRGKVREISKKRIAGKDVPSTYEARALRKDGEVIDAEFAVSIIEYKGEQAVLGAARDITERKKAEKELQENEKKYRQIFNNANDAMYLHGISEEGMPGQFLEVNDVACEMLGYTREELLSMSPQDIDAGRKAEEVPDIIEDLITNGQITFEMRKETKDGQFVPVEISSHLFEMNGEKRILSIARDMSERKELQRKQKLFSSSLDQASLGVYWVKPDGNFAYTNKKVNNMLGYSDEELTEMYVWDINPTTDNGEDKREEIWGRLKEKGTLNFETVNQTKEGDKFPVEVTSTYIQHGGEEYEIAFVKDITERKEASEKLKKSEKQFRRAIQYAPYPMMIHAEDGQVVAINDTWLEITGYEREDISTISDWIEKAYGEARNNVKEHIEKLFELEERLDEGEYEIQTKEGSTRVWDFSSTPLGEAIAGERRLVLSVADDVTARKKIMSELTEKEKEMSVLFSNLPGIAYRCENDRDWTMRFVSQGAKELTGYLPEDLIDNAKVSFGELIVPEDKERVWNEVQQALDSDQLYELEYRIKTKEGKEKHVWARGRGVYTDEGELKNLQGFISDITERKQMKDQIDQDKQNLRRSFVELAETTSRVLGVRDPYTQKHELRVGELAREVGERMGLGKDKLLGLYIGGVLHDIGKIVVPETILTKPGELKDVEWEMIKSHPGVGYNQILEDTDFPWPVAEMTLHHHERLDGSGYPHGLEGDELTEEVQILGAVDVVEAMSTRRPYREARSKEMTLNVIKDGKGDKFDPEVVEVLVEMVNEGEIEFGGE